MRVVALLLASASAPLFACTPIASLPVTVSSPGQYCLTGDLSFIGSGAAILIDADNVILDLRGYAISAGGPTSATAVQVSASTSFKLRNGQIRSASKGLSCFTSSDVEVEGVQFQNVSNAIATNQCSYVVIRNNRVFDSLGTAIQIGGSSVPAPEYVATIRGNEIAAVGGVSIATTAVVYGIHSEFASTIIDRNFIGGVRGGSGSAGIRAGGGSLISDNLIVSVPTSVSCVPGSPSEKATRNVTTNGTPGFNSCLSQSNY